MARSQQKMIVIFVLFDVVRCRDRGRLARFVRALTLCCGLNFGVGMFSDGAARNGIESMFFFQIRTRAIPQGMALILSFLTVLPT